MTKIVFKKEEKERIVQKMQQYFNNELNQTLGQFDAEFLLDFFSDDVGSFYYNRGLLDAQAVLHEKAEHIADAIYALEKPIPFSR
ncbi:MAG TPA: DUF2164 domain-containing protein [Porticoccaceae bacterium]|mgnify:CR=1|jgi:uncharacterized protein (DUF2164 family)|nr:DUF2164 domain-containing protein [Porticoccaceae bacterium]